MHQLRPILSVSRAAHVIAVKIYKTAAIWLVYNAYSTIYIVSTLSFNVDRIPANTIDDLKYQIQYINITTFYLSVKYINEE